MKRNEATRKMTTMEEEGDVEALARSAATDVVRWSI